MEGKTSTKIIKVEIDNFVFYRKSKTGLIVGKTVEPLTSNGKPFLSADADCKLKFKLDCPNLFLASLAADKFVEFEIKNTCEEKILRGVPVKQFTVEAVANYYEDDQREIVQFWLQTDNTL